MDDFSLIAIYDYATKLMDKEGSDYVQLPKFFRVFKTETLSFIRERLPVIEKTQTIKEDLTGLLVGTKRDVFQDPEDVYAVLSTLPNNHLHLIRANAMFKGGVSGRKPRLVRHGSQDALMSDPNQTPTVEYPLIFQYMDYIKIYSGYKEKATGSIITYLKKPTYADISETSQRIVNLPDMAIEDILLKTIASLDIGNMDDRVQGRIHQEKSFGTAKL